MTFVGSKGGLENQVVPATGYELVSFPVKGFPRREYLAWPGFFYGLLRSATGAFGLVKRERPAVVVGMGGFAGFPAVAAALVFRRPVVIHEQNAVPGMANRWLSRWAEITALTFEDEAGAIKSPRKIVIGNPVRRSVLGSKKPAALKKLGLDERPVTVLVFGGSRGARKLNEAVIGAYDMFRHAHNLQVVHVTGKMEHERFQKELEAVRRRHDTVKYHIFPYMDDMGAAYAAADLVVSRAGATTVAELTAVGLPSILVPYPYATDDHQTANAKYLERAGAARMVSNDTFGPQRFWQLVSGFAYRPDSLKEMAARARELGRPDAAARLADLVLETARGAERERKAAVGGDQVTII